MSYRNLREYLDITDKTSDDKLNEDIKNRILSFFGNQQAKGKLDLDEITKQFYNTFMRWVGRTGRKGTLDEVEHVMGLMNFSDDQIEEVMEEASRDPDLIGVNYNMPLTKKQIKKLFWHLAAYGVEQGRVDFARSRRLGLNRHDYGYDHRRHSYNQQMPSYQDNNRSFNDVLSQLQQVHGSDNPEDEDYTDDPDKIPAKRYIDPVALEEKIDELGLMRPIVQHRQKVLKSSFGIYTSDPNNKMDLAKIGYAFLLSTRGKKDDSETTMNYNSYINTKRMFSEFGKLEMKSDHKAHQMGTRGVPFYNYIKNSSNDLNDLAKIGYAFLRSIRSKEGENK